MSDSVWPHRRQPVRLPRPWDPPGKNTGVGCHFLLQCMKSEKWKWSHSVVSDSEQPHGLQPTRLLHPWDFPGKSTGVGCHCLLRVACLGFKETAKLFSSGSIILHSQQQSRRDPVSLEYLQIWYYHHFFFIFNISHSDRFQYWPSSDVHV